MGKKKGGGGQNHKTTTTYFIKQNKKRMQMGGKTSSFEQKVAKDVGVNPRTEKAKRGTKPRFHPPAKQTTSVHTNKSKRNKKKQKKTDSV